MIISDTLYGKTVVNERILVELIRSPSVQRLKDISQYGIPDPYYHMKNYSRYEHSLGVMILLHRLGVSLEEQVAGLLHDVSHLAFSHVIDFLYGQGKKGIEDHQDSIHTAYIRQTEIPFLLKKHGFTLGNIFSYDDFPILEKNQPEICADRVDFALREFKYWLNPPIVEQCLKSLMVFKNQLVFNSVQSAWLFAVNYLELQTRHWGGYEAMMRYYLFSKVLQRAIENKEISKKDLFGSEKPIIGCLEKSPDKKIREILILLRKKILPPIKPTEGKNIYKKFRHVDPPVLYKNSVKKLSRLKPEYLILVEKHHEINRQGLVV